MLTKKEYNEYLRKSFICIRKDDPPESYDFNGLINAYKSFNIKSFYKYSSLESPYTIDNLNKSTFHFSLIQDLNDIFEFSYNVYDVGKEISNRKELLSHIVFIEEPTKQEINNFVDVRSSLKNVFDKIKAHTFIYSLTTSYNNYLMWAHYANSYNGICVEYDAMELFKKYYIFIAPVEYSEHIPKIEYNASSCDIIRYLHECCSTKEKCWQYEEEWRIIKIDLCEKRSAMNDYMKPKSITVGYNANPKDIEKIKQICNKNDILFYKLDKANDGTFKTVR